MPTYNLLPRTETFICLNFSLNLQKQEQVTDFSTVETSIKHSTAMIETITLKLEEWSLKFLLTSCRLYQLNTITKTLLKWLTLDFPNCHGRMI